MVEQIYGSEELLDVMYHGYTVCIHLTQEKIKLWKENGNFAHVRKELADLPDLKFSCTKLENGDCKYYFVASTEKTRNMIHDMLEELNDYNRKVPITKCSSNCHGYAYLTDPYVEGDAQTCPLFK